MVIILKDFIEFISNCLHYLWLLLPISLWPIVQIIERFLPKSKIIKYINKGKPSLIWIILLGILSSCFMAFHEAKKETRNDTDKIFRMQKELDTDKINLEIYQREINILTQREMRKKHKPRESKKNVPMGTIELINVTATNSGGDNINIGGDWNIKMKNVTADKSGGKNINIHN